MDVLQSLCDVEDVLGITHKALKGVKVKIDPNAQTFPSAYKYTPESTQFNAEFDGKEWKITRIYRDTCGRHKVRVEHTEASKAAIVEKLTRW